MVNAMSMPLANAMSSSLRLMTKFEIFTDSKSDSIFWIAQNYSWLVRVPDLVGTGQFKLKKNKFVRNLFFKDVCCI